MNIEWMNKKTVAAVLTVSCVLVGTYVATASMQFEPAVPAENKATDFIGFIVDAEASLYGLEHLQTQQAQQQLKSFYQLVDEELTPPVNQNAEAVTQFMADADNLIRQYFPVVNLKASVTQALAAQQRNITLCNWMLLSLAREYGVEASMTSLSDHNHLVLKTQDQDWITWRVGHFLDAEEVELVAMDEYQLWTALDMDLAGYYISNNLHGNDDSIEALVKSAAMDGENIHAQFYYKQFLSLRDDESAFALLVH